MECFSLGGSYTTLLYCGTVMWDHLFTVYYVLGPLILSKIHKKFAKEEAHLASISQVRETLGEMKSLAQGDRAT